MASGDIHALKRALTERARDVCEMLYPGGKVEGNEFVYDPGAGKIKVVLRGVKAGIWSHFGGDGGGDLIDLWRLAKSQTLVEALSEIRDYLGIERPCFYGEKNRAWPRPQKPKCNEPRGRVRDYLCEERNIPGEILDAYKVGENGSTIIFPFMRDGELIMAKAREGEDGAKPKPTTAGCEKILFGWQAIDGNAREVVITEGEIDALSMAAYGYPALSVPYGGGSGGKQDWIESEYDRLQRFETIYLCLDNDPEGELAEAEIARRLGYRCRKVKLPHKDANECLVAGVPKSEIDRRIAEAESSDPEGLRRPSEYLDAVTQLLWPANDQLEGYGLPFAGTERQLRFRPGELTIWAGPTGAGKSMILSYAQVHWLGCGSRICTVSLEMAPSRSLARMAKQASNTTRPTREMIASAFTWLDTRLLIYDHVGKAPLSRLLEVFDYARAKYDCDQFVIDSLMRLGIKTDDYNGQEDLMFRLVTWALASKVHVHLVAHTRKLDKLSGAVQDGEDVKGASEIGANASNILVLWRNRKREAAEENGPPEGDKQRAAYDDLMAKPGVVVTVAKQRNGDFEGRVPLWFNRETYQYRGRQDDKMGRHFAPGPNGPIPEL